MKENKLIDFFNFIAFEIEGIHKQNQLYGIYKTKNPDVYQKVENLLAENKEDELEKVVLDFYKKAYKESKAEKLPEPLNYYYFDFWLTASSEAENLIIRAYNKFMRTKISKLAFNMDMMKDLKDVIQHVVTYFSIKRKFFHLSVSPQPYRCSWVVRTLKIESYILNNIVLDDK